MRSLGNLEKELDKLFADYIKLRDNWTCQRCGRKYWEHDENIQCSHYWNRGNMGTRYERDNCIALCKDCHSLWESDPNNEYTNFIKKNIGIQRYETLERLARQPFKIGKLGMLEKINYMKSIIKEKKKIW